MGREERLYPHRERRIRVIHNAVKKGGYPCIQELMNKVEISRRTLERDMAILRDDYNAPLEYCTLNKGYYYSDTLYDLPPLDLSKSEIQALLLGKRIMQTFQDFPQNRDIQTAVAKLMEGINKATIHDLTHRLEHIFFDLGPLPADGAKVGEYLIVLSESIARGKRVKLTYYTFARDQWTDRELSPRAIRFHNGCYYLIAYCHYRKAHRYFALNRMENLKGTGRDSYLDEHFNVQTFFQESFGLERDTESYRIQIIFYDSVARWIKERHWHDSQEMKELSDGRLELTMEVNGLQEVKRWVFTFGDKAQVLKPDCLREEIREDIQGMMEKYSLQAGDQS